MEQAANFRTKINYASLFDREHPTDKYRRGFVLSLVTIH